jgi:ribosome maturation factor RimP
VEAVVAPVVGEAGFDLEGLTMRNAGSRRILRLLLDSDAGITLEEVAQVSRAVSEALDASAVMGEAPYLLDVGSPGVDRPLTLLRHWRRNTGRLVRVVGLDGTATLGRVVDAQGPAGDAAPAVVLLDVDGRERELDPAQCKRAVVQVEFRDGPDDDGDDGDDPGATDQEHEPQPGGAR